MQARMQGCSSKRASICSCSGDSVRQRQGDDHHACWRDRDPRHRDVRSIAGACFFVAMRMAAAQLRSILGCASALGRTKQRHSLSRYCINRAVAGHRHQGCGPLLVRGCGPGAIMLEAGPQGYTEELWPIQRHMCHTKRSLLRATLAASALQMTAPVAVSPMQWPHSRLFTAHSTPLQLHASPDACTPWQHAPCAGSI